MLSFISLILCKKFKLKHSIDNLYIGITSGRYPSWTTLANSSLFEDEESVDKGLIIIKVINTNGKVWDIERSIKNLIYYPKTGASNQRFEIEVLTEGNVRIKSGNGQCITYSESAKIFQRMDCVSGKLTQIFVLTDENGIVKKENDSDFGAVPEIETLNEPNTSDKLSNPFGSKLGSDVFNGSVLGGMNSFGHPMNSLNHILSQMFDSIPIRDKQRLIRSYLASEKRMPLSTERFSFDNMDICFRLKCFSLRFLL